MHLRNLAFFLEPVAIYHLLNYELYTNPRFVLLWSTALMSGVVLLNLLSIFLNEPNLKLSVSSKIQTSQILYSLLLSCCRSSHLLPLFPWTLLSGNQYYSSSRSSTYSQPFQGRLPNPQTLSHKSSVIPRTSQLWDSLPPTTFPESYNLSSYKSNINKLDLVSLST